ncbi:MAG: MBL fold metallo-hydrolase [Rhodocyclaceae bacterium]|nr:MBL fold metallo-hydrolase [Rhodocyclaceae bacterium]
MQRLKPLLALFCFLHGLLCLPASASPSLLPTLVPEQVAPGVYALLAHGDKPTPRNGGFTANGGFVVGTSGVVVINAGPSRNHARAVVAAIARVTRLPIKMVIDTHARPEQVLGTGYFTDNDIPVLAHRVTVRLMEQRCRRCLRVLTDHVGEAAMAGTRIALPRPDLEDGETLDAGGRQLELIVPSQGVIPGGTAVLDRQSGVLFTGALLYLDHIPDLQEADLGELEATFDRLAALPASLVIPDRGPPSPPSRVAEFRRYINALQANVGLAYAAGTSLSELEAAVQLPEFTGWKGYAEHHGGNARAFYLRLEHSEPSAH